MFTTHMLFVFEVFFTGAVSDRLHPAIGQNMLCEVCTVLMCLVRSDKELKSLESQWGTVHLCGRLWPRRACLLSFISHRSHQSGIVLT